MFEIRIPDFLPSNPREAFRHGWIARDAIIKADASVETVLSQPEPEGPTDEELMDLAVEVFDDPCATDKDYARAVLARWGNHPGSPDSSPQPIPVSERLPGPEDCDGWERNHPISNIWCWWWDSDEGVWTRDEADTPRPSYYTHWLPAHALTICKD